MIPCEVARPITGEAPSGVHLLNSQGVGHLDLQNRIIRYSLLKVTGDVQALVFLGRRFDLRGVTVLMQGGTLRVISLTIWATSGGDECCCLVKSRLVPQGLAGSLLLAN